MNRLNRLKRVPLKEQEKESYKHIDESLDNNDFKRHVTEVSEKLKLPEDVVEKVLRHYFKSIVKFAFMYRKIKKRIIIYTAMNLEFRPYKRPRLMNKKKINNN